MSKKITNPKIYNPLALDIEKDEPTFINKEGVKWWLVSRGSHLSETKDTDLEAVYRVMTKDRQQAYVVVDDDGIKFDTGNLENALAKVDELYLIRSIK